MVIRKDQVPHTGLGHTDERLVAPPLRAGHQLWRDTRCTVGAVGSDMVTREIDAQQNRCADTPDLGCGLEQLQIRTLKGHRARDKGQRHICPLMRTRRWGKKKQHSTRLTNKSQATQDFQCFKHFALKRRGNSGTQAVTTYWQANITHNQYSNPPPHQKPSFGHGNIRALTASISGNPWGPFL